MNDNDNELLSFAELQSTAREAAAAGKSLMQRARESGTMEELRHEADLRQFVSPHQPNSKYLAIVGKARAVPLSVNSNGIEILIDRQGDKWAEFASGVLTTDDPDVIEWCEAHTGDPKAHDAYHRAHGMRNPRDCGAPVGLCMPEGPNVGVWAKLKELTISTANHDVQIPPEIDIDALVRSGAGNMGVEALGSEMRTRAKANKDAESRRRE